MELVIISVGCIIILFFFTRWCLREEKHPVPSKKPIKNAVFHRYTVRMIIRWEQLMKKPFSQMDYSSKEDIDAFLYVMNVDNTPYTFEVFKTALENDGIFKDLMLRLDRAMGIMAQFQGTESSDDTKSEGGISCSIGEIVSMLVMGGLDAHYAMEEMDLCDLPLYIEAYERKRKEELENARLWTYISILPHIDGKKVSSPQVLYPFPWETDEMRRKAEKEMRENEEQLMKFLNGDLFDINKINWKSRGN
jgi:hypothetical protein